MSNDNRKRNKRLLDSFKQFPWLWGISNLWSSNCVIETSMANRLDFESHNLLLGNPEVWGFWRASMVDDSFRQSVIQVEGSADDDNTLASLCDKIGLWSNLRYIVVLERNASYPCKVTIYHTSTNETYEEFLNGIKHAKSA